MSEPTVEALALPYGSIVGDGATVHADGSDINPHPDVAAFDNVRVIFTPSDGNGRRVNTVIWTGVDGPTVLHPQIETGRFVDGRLVLDVPTPPQPDGMRLMATVSDDMVPNSWGWKMEWTGWPSGKGPGPVIFPLAPGATVDIAEALAGYLPEVPAVDFANLLAAADEVLTARDQTVALRDEVQVISGLTGEDAAVATIIANPTTQTSTALRTELSDTFSRLNLDPAKRYSMVTCALRNVGGTDYWQVIEDANHTPVNVASVTTGLTGITVNFDLASTQRVIWASVTPDEAMATGGYFSGASVGLNNLTIKLGRTGTIASYIAYNGTTWTTQGDISVTSFGTATGTLNLTHEVIRGFGASAVTRQSPLVASIGTIGTTATTIFFRDPTGAVVTTPNTDMKVYVSRTHTGTIDHRDIPPGFHNLWVAAIIETA